ncbi:MAG: phosphate propanoyltransferase [Clostridiales bacterium]|nr:phosphate propanoyltransferase [Clostridiales bacterium]
MSDQKIMIEVSARHMHVSRADLDVLYGPGHQLTNKKDLSQPGQFACEERVTVVGPKGQLTMSILGPERPATQVEVSLTDARALGIAPPVRESGDIAGTPGVKLVGPKGEVELKEGVMVAKRHIHFHSDEAKQFGVVDKQIAKVRFEGPRGVIFEEVVCRVSDKFALAMHIDTDEANAAGIAGQAFGELVK